MARELDGTDVKILRALQRNARLSNKELAAHIELAESTCLERVRRLERDGVLRGYHADVDAPSVGARLHAMIMLRLQKHSREVVESFRDHLLSQPEVVDVYLVAGVHDFLVHVIVRDSEHLRNMELDKITVRPEVVQIETALVFEHHRDHVGPAYVAGAEPEPAPPRR